MGCCLCSCLIKKIGGQWQEITDCFVDDRGLSYDARNLINKAFEGLDVTKIVDVHCHLIGIHSHESGCYVHENMDKCCRCISYSKKFVILQASGVDINNPPDSDKPYYQRLVQLYENFIPPHIQNKVRQNLESHALKTRVIQNTSKTHEEKYVNETSDDSKTALLQTTNHAIIADDDVSNNQQPICPKVVLLGLDQVYNRETGLAEPHHTSVYTPEQYVEHVVNQNNHVFILGPSINPYRKDAVDKLVEYKHKGCNVIKWLPNSMAINPSDPLCDAFYDKLSELNMFLLAHTGQEHSLDDADFTFQEYGNPLRYKGALTKGVKVIMAHCASEGCDEDLEDEKANHEQVNSCDLFIRMMRDEQYNGLLYGDISAMTGFKRVQQLQKIIQCTDIHHRLIYGSDYPVPAINGVVWQSRLVSAGLLTAEQSAVLKEIFKYNPVLADFVSKRTMRYRDAHGTMHKFSDVIFQQYPLICSNTGIDLQLSGKQKKNQ